MKKNLKKNVITSSIVTALAAATISPVAIALSQPSENNLVSPTSADGMSTISVGNFGINNNATVFAGVSESDKSTVYAQNPNVTKSVPNGLVTVTNSGKRITVFSQDNPNEIL